MCVSVFVCVWVCLPQVFVYPDNVAFPFGGEGSSEYVVMELHYDNPEEIAGRHVHVLQ